MAENGTEKLIRSCRGRAQPQLIKNSEVPKKLCSSYSGDHCTLVVEPSDLTGELGQENGSS